MPASTPATEVLARLKKDRLDNICLVNSSGELVALATREYFKVGVARKEACPCACTHACMHAQVHAR
eukprot:358640-Chlamydomonas_euryale.AAC.5